MSEFQTYTDGGARGNPGPAALGVVIKDNHGKTVREYGRYLGETTNNQAEYQALISALETVRELGGTSVRCYLDSELIVKQMKRQYRVKEPSLQSLFLKAWNLAQQCKTITFTHIPREKNHEADRMVNEAIDAHAASPAGS